MGGDKDSGHRRKVSASLENQGLAVLRFNFSLRHFGRTLGEQKAFTRHEGELRAILAHLPRLAERYSFDPTRVGLFGTSTGANVVMHVAREKPAGVRALALLGTFDLQYLASHPEKILGELALSLPPRMVPKGITAGKEFLADARARNSRAIAAALTQPVLFLHGESDGTAPLIGAHALFANVPVEKEFKTIPRASHSYRDSPGKTDITDAIAAHAGRWFKRHLG
jgi:pimeloyl-ACP methyl ester carboxylesterase